MPLAENRCRNKTSMATTKMSLYHFHWQNVMQPLTWLAMGSPGGSTLIEQVLLEALHQHVAVGLQLGPYSARPRGREAKLGDAQRREPCCDRHLQILQRQLPAPLLLRRQSPRAFMRCMKEILVATSLTAGDFE